jgi:hypothetical protein
MKSFEDMLYKAVTIADNDPNAFVCLIANNIRQKLQFVENWTGLGVYKASSGRYVSSSSGQVVLVNYREDIAWELSGYQWTHVIAEHKIDVRTKDMLKVKLRYHKEPFPEPSGFYTDIGIVERLEAW